MGGQIEGKGVAGKTVSGEERSDSRSVMGWIRQSSMKRFRSREVGGSPREHRRHDDDEASVCTLQTAPHKASGAHATSKGDHSLAAMFMSVPSRTKLKDELHANAEDGAAGMHRAHTTQSLGALHAGSMVHESSVSIDHARLDSGRRSVRSAPGDLIDEGDHEDSTGGRLPQSNCEDTAAKHNQTGKPKRISSSSGFGRIGSFFTRSFSKHRSRSNRHSKDESPPSATELEATEAPPVLPGTVSAAPAFPLAVLDALPDFSAADWLAKFEKEGGGEASIVMTVCGGALEAVAAHLAELEENIRLLQQNDPKQQQQQQQHKEVDAGETAQGLAERLAATRQQMDRADEQVFSQLRYQGEQIIIGELKQMIATVKNIMHGVKYAACSDTAVQHDLQGETEQLQAWQKPCGALRENRNCLEALYAQVRSTRDEVLLNYHEECIRLNQSVQLLMDRITNTVTEVFAEFEEPPSLESLYGRQELNIQEQKCTRMGAELRHKSSSSWGVGHQQAFARLPPFIERLQLYAFNSPFFSNDGWEVKGLQREPQASTVSQTVQATRLFTPLTLNQCLPRKSCVNSVPPGLALMATQAEIELYESKLWSDSASGPAGEGGFGSFRVFEQWLVDAMKWQWRDAFMYSKLHERHGSLQAMIKEKRRDIQEAVRLRLKQLWWGRTVEMQAVHATQAAVAFMEDLRGVEELHAVPAEERKKGKEGADRLRGTAVFESLLLRSGREAELALMRAEDMRASVLRVVGNPAYQYFKRSLDEFNARPSDAAAHIAFLRQQAEKVASLKRRFEDSAEGKEGYETLQKECNQLEAALALLEVEAKALESKLSFRQSQLSAKRQNLTRSLEQLSEAFDADNRKLAVIEAQWDSAEKIGQLLQDILPTAEEIASCKQKLAEDRKQLETEREEIQTERQRLEAIREECEKAKKMAASANSSSTAGDPDKPRSSTPTSSQAAASGTDHQLSRTPSKSFVGRLFGGSSRPSTPRKSGKAANEAAAATAEAPHHPGTLRQGSANVLPVHEELLPLKHGHSAPMPLVHASKCSSEVREVVHSQQTNAEQSTQGLSGPPAKSHSSQSLLALEQEGRKPPPSLFPAAVNSLATEADPHRHSAESESAEILEGARHSAEVLKRKKSKNATGIGSSRRGSRKKKSMYSKLRSAFSLSHSSKKDSKGTEAASHVLENLNTANEYDAAKGSSSGSQESQEGNHWHHMGSQSSVLATIPNIFEGEGEERKDEKDNTYPANANAAFSLMVGTSSKSEASSNQPAADVALHQEAAASSGREPLATTLVLTGKGSCEAVTTLSLAESFRRASPDLAEGIKKEEGLQERASPTDFLSRGGVNKFPSDSSVQEEEHSPQFGTADLKSNAEDSEEMSLTAFSDASNKAAECRQAEGAAHTPVEGGPLVAFPSLSAGSPADFRSGVEDLVVPANSSFHAEEPSQPSSQRRRSDTAVRSSLQYTTHEGRKHGRWSGRAAAFERVFAAGFRRQFATGLVDEDDRIEVFLSNNQPDLTAAVMSSSIFALLEPEERQHCVHLMLNSFVQIPKGCMLVQKGEKVDTLYFVVSGELGMTEPNAAELEANATAGLTPPTYTARRRSSYDGEVPQDKFPVKLCPGAFVLPRAFVREAQTNHSVMALRPCTLQKLSFHSFQQVISSCIFRRASQVMSYLGNCPILDSLTRRERVQIATLMKWRIYLPDEVMCFQGEICSGVLVVVHGCARAVRFVERQGNPEVVDEFSPGDNINALALLHDTPSDVSIVATSPDGCVVAVLERNELQQSLGDAEAILNRRFGNTGELEGGRTSGLHQLKKQFSSFWSRRGSG